MCICLGRFTGLDQYKNEDSAYLADVRRRIEAVWLPWERNHLAEFDTIRAMDASQVGGRTRVCHVKCCALQSGVARPCISMLRGTVLQCRVVIYI